MLLLQPSLQMRVNTEHQQVQTHASQRQYVYCYCQQYRLTPGYALLISVCIFILPMLELAAEHVHLTATTNMNSNNHWHIYSHRMTFSHTPLVLPFLNNVLPAMVLQNKPIIRIRCSMCTSSRFSVLHFPPSPMLTVPFDLWRKIAGLVMALLVLMSGDIETNPGPLGEFVC